MPPQTPCPNHAAMEQRLEEGSKTFERFRKDLDGIFQRMNKAENDITNLRGQLEGDRKLTRLEIGHLEEKLDALKALLEEIGGRIDTAMQAPMKAVEALGADVDAMKGKGAKRLDEIWSKLLYDGLKLLIFGGGFGAALALMQSIMSKGGTP